MIDDFGMRYSSPRALMRFPLDELKIERSFVSGTGAGSLNGRPRPAGRLHGQAARGGWALGDPAARTDA